MEEKRKKIIDYAGEKNVVIEPNAIGLLEGAKDYRKVIDELALNKEMVLSRKSIEKKLNESKPKEVIIKKKGFNPIAREVEARIKVLDELNVTNQSTSEGKVKDFIAYFQDKFNSLEAILKKRPNFNPIPIKRVKLAGNNTEIEFIGMIRDKWKTKNENIALRLEDLEGECIGVISKENARITKQSERILPDYVIGVKGTKISKEMIIIKEIILPEIPLNKFKKAERALNLVAISDLHVGSKLFLEHSFQRFLEWLKGNTGSEKERKFVGKIKYLFVLGDSVDGIGIYPKQINELNIRDIYEQYKKLEEIMLEVPEYIEVVIIPGQHDAVRFADPQPALPKEFVPELYKRKNFHFLSSPGWIEVEGLKCLLYHGPSLHDLYSSVSYLSYNKPQDAVIELIKKRDLMPSYGMKRPYVPEKKDYMLLKEVPDLYFGGDLHHNGYGEYRGTIVVCAGTWQKKTEFQVTQGHSPTPGIASILELNTGKIHERAFYTEEAGEGTVLEEMESEERGEED
ncbi:MAG: DNA-directed DNA polymerase II small subunit [archaeon]|nr:DNA-directed DNA polymerase II small subunit [Candidatus Micrarchaeota archaeon]